MDTFYISQNLLSIVKQRGKGLSLCRLRDADPSWRPKVLPARSLFNLYQTADSISDNLKRHGEGRSRSGRDEKRTYKEKQEGKKVGRKDFLMQFFLR